MKKTYVSPAVAETTIETESLIATSDGIMLTSDNADTSVSTTQLDGGRRGEWGNLWN